MAGWVSEQVLKVLRTNVTTQVVANGWPILGLSVHSPEIEQAAITSANGQLESYGLAVSRMGNFTITLAPEDEAQLKRLAKDTGLLAAGGRLPAVRGGRDGARRRAGHGPGRRRDRGRVPRRGLRVPGMMAGGMQQQQQRPRSGARRSAAGAAGTSPGAATAAGPACASCYTAEPEPARSSAWAAARPWPRPSSTAPNAGTSCQAARSSAPTAAPGQAKPGG